MRTYALDCTSTLDDVVSAGDDDVVVVVEEPAGALDVVVSEVVDDVATSFTTG